MSQGKMARQAAFPVREDPMAARFVGLLYRPPAVSDGSIPGALLADLLGHCPEEAIMDVVLREEITLKGNPAEGLEAIWLRPISTDEYARLTREFGGEPKPYTKAEGRLYEKVFQGGYLLGPEEMALLRESSRINKTKKKARKENDGRNNRIRLH